MSDALVTGLLAGYGIAMPVGAMSVLIVTLSAQVSLRQGLAAALGTATADGLYALIAVLGGAAIAGVVSTAATPLQMASAAALALIALYSFATAVRRHRAQAPEPAATTGSPLRTYVSLVGLTLLNPVTIVYFGALVVGHDATADSLVNGVVFVSAAFGASVSWQAMLACGGALLGRVLTGARGRLATAVVGNTVILLLAARLAWSAAG